MSDDELSEIRGVIIGGAERVGLPGRFQVVAIESQPQVMIIDTVTKRAAVIGLCDYYGVRKVLGDLFPDE